MSEPRILLLDEPTAGLTGAEIARLAAMLRTVRDERGVTILLVEHNVPFVFGLCNAVTAMHEGARIASGTPVEIRVNEAVVESYPWPASWFDSANSVRYAHHRFRRDRRAYSMCAI